MQDFFKKMRIRAKLLLAFSSIILLSIFLMLYAIASMSRVISVRDLSDESQQLLINLERIEISTKEFIYEGYKQKSFQESEKSEILDRYQSALNATYENLKLIGTSKVLSDPKIKAIVDTLRKSSVIAESFEATRALLKKRGFKDYGLEGSLRAAIHKIESSGKKYDRAPMLTLRRHEKDFFLRKDLKYLAEFNKAITTFGEELDRQGGHELISLLANYREEFNQVVTIEEQIGLTDKEGTKGQLFMKLQAVRSSVETIRKSILETTGAEISQSRIWLVLIFGIQLIVAVVLAITYSNVLANVIKEIRTTMSKLAEGVFPPPLKVRTNEEIGETKTAINHFLDRMKSATSYAEKLGTGNLNAIYDERFNSDVLARALINMQKKLSDAEAVQSKINWANEGTAKFNELLRKDADDISTLGGDILNLFVSHIHANQAALYIINHDEKCLERISTYAYNKKRCHDNKIDLECGLIGQCAKEGETIHLKEIPNDYVKITSGLGEATPRNIMIVPLKYRGEINGIIEIASFEIFQESHIGFVEKMADTISAFVSNRQAAGRTKKLLEESKLKAETLSMQEEELRQGTEELLATQEEMQRQRKELENEIFHLRGKIKSYEEQAEVYLALKNRDGATNIAAL
jgi:methyl-accepting chemotaxis protein